MPNSTNLGRRAARVFIGLPVYNGGRFLAATLDSLLHQTYPDFTLLISDNGSTDDTPEICANFATRDSRILYVRQASNIGAPRNWNFVAQQAHGEYFKWASASDLCAPDMLERCVTALDADPTAALCQGRTCLVDEETDAKQVYDNDLALLDSRPSQRLRQLALRLALNNGQSGLIRLSFLRQTRLDRLYPGGDFALMAELALTGRFIVLPEVLLYRRMGTTTFSRHLKNEQIGQFYGEQALRTIAGHTLDTHFDVLRAVCTMRLPWSERLPALAFSLRRLLWDRGVIWTELRQRFLLGKA